MVLLLSYFKPFVISFAFLSVSQSFAIHRRSIRDVSDSQLLKALQLLDDVNEGQSEYEGGGYEDLSRFLDRPTYQRNYVYSEADPMSYFRYYPDDAQKVNDVSDKTDAGMKLAEEEPIKRVPVKRTPVDKAEMKKIFKEQKEKAPVTSKVPKNPFKQDSKTNDTKEQNYSLHGDSDLTMTSRNKKSVGSEPVAAEGEMSFSNNNVKRSTPATETASESYEELSKELKEQAVKLLETYINLQEDENNKLVKALNLATLGFVSGDPSYIDEEMDYIKKAISDEEVLAVIKKKLVGSDDDDDDDEGDENNFAVDEDDDDTDGNDDEILNENREETALGLPQLDDENSFGRIRRGDVTALKNQLADMILRKVLQEARNNGERQLDTDNYVADLSPYLADLQPSPTEDNGFVLNPFLRDVETWTKHGPVTEFNFETNEEECMAVMNSLTDNCAAATDRGFVMDGEAIDLCNRHQLCYSCGSFYGLVPETCNRDYLTTAEFLCGGKEECQDQAANLYLTMLERHPFIRDTSPLCSSTCVVDVIAGKA